MFSFLWRRNPLTLLLWASLTLPGLVAIAIIAWSYNQTLEEAQRSAEDDATIVREHAMRVFEAQIGAIAIIDARIADMSWDEIRASEDVHRLLKSLSDASPHINGLWLVDPAGTVSNSADFFPMPPTDTTSREYFLTLRDFDVTHLGEMIRGKLKGNLNFNISRRRSAADGSFDGLILVTSDLDYFETFWQNFKADTARIVFIARDDGRILARYPGVENAQERVPADSRFFDVVASGGGGTFEGQSVSDGKDRLFVVEPLEGFAAYIGIGVDRAGLLAAWTQRSMGLALLAAAVTAFLVWIVYKAARAEANLIAKEEHVAVIEAVDAQLRESQARFLALFETSTQGILHLATDGTILDLNPAAEHIFGVDPAASTGKKVRDLNLDIVGEDGNPVAPEDRPDDVVRRTGQIVTDLILGLRAPETGRMRWLKMDAIPQWRASESLPWSMFLLVNDITEQRRSAQAERTLAAEVDHRAKNMLALVQAIVRLSRSESPKQFVEAVEGRIGALSRAHGLLSVSKWGDVDLHSVIEEAVAPYRGKENRDSITVSGPALALKPETAQPISLLVHELTTNAIKHGALSVPTGHIAVTWSLDGAAGNLNIEWVESGGPPTAEPTRTSFGTRLIRLSVHDDLGGDIVRDWRLEGLLARIWIPATHLGGRADPAAPTQRPAEDGAPSGVVFAGARILIVEDNALVAAEMADHLVRLGCTVIGPAGSLEEATRMISAGPMDAAILDVDLRGQRVYPVADIARTRGIPTAFCTGFSTLDELSERWPDAIIVQKPVSHENIERALARLLAMPVG